MKRVSLPWVLVFLASACCFSALAQTQPASPGIATGSTAQALSSNVIAFSDIVTGQPDGPVTTTFALYPDRQSTTPAWTETQVVQVVQGKYSVLLGAATANGIPPEAFAADQAHWLGVQISGTEKRYLLVSVPYAMKAMEADRLGGLLPSDFVTTAQLQVALQNAAAGSGSTTNPGTKPAASGPVGQASLNPPQPATDFTDNNTSEVLLVTQQGTGFAVHAISSGDAALFGENTTATGTAVRALASGTSGANIGLLAQSASPTGIAGVFDNTGNGQILSLRNNGNEVASVDNAGDFRGNIITANGFNGNGGGLFGIPNSATTANTGMQPNTIALRDNGGGISANSVIANFFSGNGGGLFNVPNSATTATTASNPNTIVQRDNGGGISANSVVANFFSGNGGGLFGIPNSATTATTVSTPNTIVLRDNGGSISANSVISNFFSGNGAGLFNIPNSATSASSANTPNTIVARDSSGGFVANNIQAFGLSVGAGGLSSFGLIDFSSGTTTPVHAVLSANTPTSCTASKELLIKTDATPGQQLFICNATGSGYVLVGDGTSTGVTSVGAGDGSVAIGGTAAAPTVAVAAGGITSDKLAANAVAGSIADGSLTPAKIAGTAATLSNSNVFSGTTQTMFSLNVNGLITNPGGITTSSLFAGDGNFTGSSGSPLVNVQNNGTGVGMTVGANNAVGLLASGGPAGINSVSISGVGLQAQSTNSYGIKASSTNGVGLQSTGGTIGVLALSNAISLEADAQSTTGVAAVLNSYIVGAKLLSGRMSGSIENFSLDNFGNVVSAGALAVQYPNNSVTGTIVTNLAKLDSLGNALLPATSDTSGIVGVVIGGAGTSGNAQIAYSGIASCRFDNAGRIGDYVGISSTVAGNCTDVGQTYPAHGQVIGRVLSATVDNPTLYSITVFGAAQRDSNPGTLTTINTGAGLTGGPITSSGTISIANAGVTNAMLQNSSVTVNPGSGLSGGGTASLGGSITLSNTGALSFNGRTGSITPQSGDYSFNQISGGVSSFQLPSNLVYSTQSNTFTADQTINGALNANAITTATLNGSSAVISGASNGTVSVVSLLDNSAANNAGTLSVNSQNNTAGFFLSGGPSILAAGTPTHNVLGVGPGGVNVVGSVSATSFDGDGSALTNVNASSIGGTSLANLATTSSLNAETTARQSGDTTLQNNINSESTARQSADASLATSISVEAAARQTDTNTLQTNLNNVSAADAKLAAANTFTASNTFIGGTQDFSGAGATLPVRALPSAQTPSTCVANKELLIKTDAPAGQQLFLCDTGGTTWNLVGDGASGGVTAFNGRNGSVSPASGDYSFSQISGSLAASQLPALTGDVTEAAGSGVTLLSSTGVTPGAYSKVNVDLKGRVTSGTQASFSDLTGSAAQNQLPANVVYNNQANTFSASQTVNGNLTATTFTGNGGALSNVNAAALNGLSSSSFAQLGASSNAFTGSVSAASFSGNGSNVTSVNAATVNNLQMLKVTASITPSSVTNQTCSEQSFAVSGVNSGDVLLSVQLATHSPGTNIAIGGWRVPAANTVAIQFCNVSRSSSTPTAGTYTLALMR